MSWPKVQDNRLLAALLTFLTALAWWALWRGEQSPWGHAVLHPQHAMHMNVGPLAFGFVFVLGWTVMTIAMMLPSSSPLVLLFHNLVSGRRHAYGLVALLVAGYLAVWTLFGVLAYSLNRAADSIPWPPRYAWVLGAFILMIAGLYQFSSLKYACLDKCRSPMLFLVERWSSGKRRAADAFRVGAAHGLYCVGCCWSLMLLMFVVSSGNLAWMLLLGIIMGMEKNLPWGRRLSAPVGVVLVIAAAAVVIVHV
jgi:predicted metal-binding membrane protein